MSTYARTIGRLLAGGTLDADEAEALLGEVVDGTLEPAPIAALLTALATRPETVDELVGFAQALRQRALFVAAPAGALDTCGTGGSGQSKLNVSTAAAFVLAALGVPVAKHGNRSTRGALGSADVLEHHGLPLTLPPEASARLLAETHFGFLFAPHHHPALRAVAPIRRALGFRTTFNLLGPLVNPARVQRQLVGVSDAARTPVVAAALGRLGLTHALVVTADGGLDELRPDRGATLCALAGGEIRVERHAPRTAESMPALDAPLSREEAAQHFLDVLAGEAEAALLDFVALNAGAALLVAGRAASLDEGTDLARTTLAAGAPREAFERHRAAARAAQPESIP
jgi:anthranilate phosphoribosyltransferase